MDCLSSASLDWALTHVKKFGDTDIFPVPFEFEAISHSWLAVRSKLEAMDLSSYVPGAIQRMLVPKPGGGFRVAVQSDPLDSIIYAAILFEAADAIERARLPVDQKTVFSYRVELDSSGRVFSSTSAWSEFHNRSAELASGEFTHVLLADIADFYNQIYIHRVQNALESASIPIERAKNVEQFLLRLNARQSRGIPVGPTASILLAEITLNDVDRFLLRYGCAFVRYVDDFRIFCRSRREAIETQLKLTDYLHTAHRLSLESHKTRIIHVERFIAEELTDLEEVERKAKTDKLNALVDDLKRWTGYNILPDEIPDDDRAKAVRGSISELFDICVGQRPLHLGLARHLLRRATSLKTAVLVETAMDSLWNNSHQSFVTHVDISMPRYRMDQRRHREANS